MTDRYLRALLRGATKHGILTGWQGPMVDNTYVIAPELAPARAMARDDAVEYCRALAQAGVLPVYRASEPADLTR